MTETISGKELLVRIQEAHDRLMALVAPLDSAQMVDPHVNGPWSVKDNLAHLTVWHGYLLAQLVGLVRGEKPASFFPADLTGEDDINAYFFDRNKYLPLTEVLDSHNALYQRVVEAVQTLSDIALNAPFPWSTTNSPVWSLIAGNTCDHYEEHAENIRQWLAQTK